MNITAQIGHNGAPDPIDEATAPFADLIDEVSGWLDGQKVATEGQMQAVDKLIKGMKSARKTLDEARDIATKPLHKAWQSEIARWKPTQDDYDMQIKGLVGLVDTFKRELAAEKARIARVAWDKAEAERKAAMALAAQADVSDIEAQREAKAALEAAALAQAQATVASKDTVKGMRTVTRYETLDPVLLARWLWTNDRAAQDEFHNERARKLGLNLPGIFEARTTKEAF